MPQEVQEQFPLYTERGARLRSRQYRSIDAPIKLKLEFNEITVGELSSLLRQWQALVRSAWRDSYERSNRDGVPNARILVISASTENSFEVLTDIAIPITSFAATVLGPAKDWPAVARTAWSYLESTWTARADRSGTTASDHVYIRGGETPEIRVSADALRDSETGGRVERMWEIANSGSIRTTVTGPDSMSSNGSSM